MRFLLRRIIFYLVTGWAALTLNFLIPRMMPGNPVESLLARYSSQLTPSATRALTLLFGLNHSASLWSQYTTYWAQLVHGNLGLSFTYFPASVVSVIGSSLPWSLALIGLTTIFSFVIGTLLGILSGWRRGSWWDTLAPITTFFSAVPYFWLGLACVYVFGAELHWFPLSGGYSSSLIPGLSLSFISSALYYGALPALTIVLSSMAGWLLGMRNMMVTTMAQDYVVMAEAKGLSKRRVMFAYAARNAILPSLSSFAMSLGFVVGGAILVEIVFSYPGIGFVLYSAVTNDDYPLIQGIFLCITLVVLAANFAADLVYVIVDPRTRQQA
jgi:peptide/nickel transport system permease protein